MTNYYDTWQILGQAFGIEPQYKDNWGKTHHTDPRTACRILETKGIKISAERTKLNPQVLVVSLDDMPDLARVYFEAAPNLHDRKPLQGSLTITETKGRIPDMQFQLRDERIRMDIDEDTGLLCLTVPFPKGLSTGPYYLLVDCSIEEEKYWAACVWIVCPEKAYLPCALKEGKKIAGISLALYGVRSQNNWGVGDFSDLKRLIDWCCEDIGVDFIGLNPLHALFNMRPFNSSPYLPSSRLYNNFIYLDVPRLVALEESEEAQALANALDTVRLIEKLRSEEHVNYEEVSALKLRVLRSVFSTFMEKHGSEETETDRAEAFKAYREAEGVYLERFATFCALREHFQAVLPSAPTWREWPKSFQNATSAEVKEFRRDNQSEILFWMYVQWQLDEQLRDAQGYAIKRGMILGLYLDQALAVDRNGADCWAWPHFYHDGFSVGAPPDAFAPDGQDWGFPPPDRDRHRTSGYELFMRQLESSCTHAGALRIDHVMQIYHLFWIPFRCKPADGVYVKDYEADLLNLLALVSQQNRTVIIGEDLGTVPPDFRERLMGRGVFSYRLFYFERDSSGNLYSHQQYPQSALVSITTHDLPTLAGFWSGDDIDSRKRIGMLDAEREQEFREDRMNHKAKIIEKLVQEGFLPAHVAHAAWISPLPTDDLHSAVLRFLFDTPASLVTINQEDVFLDRRQQNFPGTTWQNPNWVTKMLYTVEELRTDPEARRLSTKLKILLKDSRRIAGKAC